MRNRTATTTRAAGHAVHLRSRGRRSYTANDNESLRLELQEAIVTIRHWYSLLIQTAGFMITADVVLISYGFAQKLAGILLLASALPIGIFFIYSIVGGAMVTPLVILVQRIERKLLVGEDSLGATFKSSLGRLIGADLSDTEHARDEKVRKPSPISSRWQWLWSPVPMMLYMATATQLGIFVLALAVFHYRFM